jgi:hypothetical protein
MGLLAVFEAKSNRSGSKDELSNAFDGVQLMSFERHDHVSMIPTETASASLPLEEAMSMSISRRHDTMDHACH